MSGRHWLAVATSFVLAALGASAIAQPAPDTSTIVARMHRGVNVLGYDPIWNTPAQARFKPEYFAMLHNAGFDFIRVNLQAFAHMDSHEQLSPQWLQTLDGVVRDAQKAGLTVILDEHDFNDCSAAAATCRVKLLAFWRQVAPRYADQPDTVLFELLNEPHDQLNGEPWNALIADTLAVVRRTNPNRTVVIGPSFWNAIRDLPLLKLPENDRRILVTIHYYEPFHFTHQGAPWSSEKTAHGVVWGSDGDRARLKADLDIAAAWGRDHGRPILLGEFGAYDKSDTPMDLRATYTGAVARQAEAEGFAWSYWQFDRDFILYDIDRGEWVAPIRDALIPPAKSSARDHTEAPP